jgi:type IV secretory pathway VirB10-like protein
MLRSNMGLVLGGVAAIAAGTVGGWALLSRPVQASAPAKVQTASVLIATPTPSADEAALLARTPARTATPNPAPVAPPSRTAEAPPPAPASPAPDTAPADDMRNKPRIHIDGERSEIGFDGDKGSLHVNKDRLSVRTPLGKFEIKW